MRRFHETRFMCILIACLSIAFADDLQIYNSAVTPSNSSMTRYFTGFQKERENIIRPENFREHNVEKRWQRMETSFIKILNLMYNECLPFITQITNDLDISTTCKRDLMKMLTGIKEFKYWAVQMLDSFGKIPVGIEAGNFISLGEFDQCLNVDVPGHFQGQYCNLDMILPMPKREPFVPTFTEVPKLMRAVKPDGYFTAFGKYGRFFHFANPRASICVPSTCSRGELQKIANEAVQTMDLSFGLSIPNCEVLNKEDEFDRIEISIMIILATLLVLVISGTVVDVWLELMSEENSKKNFSLPTQYLLCFSVYRNTERLIRTDTEKDSINVFHGMRVLTTVWVIIAHSIILTNFNALGLWRFFEILLKAIFFQCIANAFVIVETFFFMSATLQAHQIIKEKKKINVKRHIFRRIWRLIPPFMLVIGCVILMPRLGSGPLWKETVEDFLAKNCRDRWWTNLLFINNFVSVKDTCLQWFWFVPADFQLYLLSFLVLIPMKRNPRQGFIISISIMVSAMVISAGFHVYYKLTPMLILAFMHHEDAYYYIDGGYFTPYVHCSSVCIGLAVGYFLANRPSKLQVPTKLNAVLWLASLGVPFAVQLGPFTWAQGQLPSIWVSTLYAVGGKILWTAGMAWITIASVTGNGGVIAKFLSLPFYIPLGRLCYMVNLIHPLIHYMYVGSTRNTIPIHSRVFIHLTAGNLILSFLCAIPLTLLFESPFLALDRLLFSEKKPEKTQSLKTLDVEYSEGVGMKNEKSNDSVENHKKAA